MKYIPRITDHLLIDGIIYLLVFLALYVTRIIFKNRKSKKEEILPIKSEDPVRGKILKSEIETDAYRFFLYAEGKCLGWFRPDMPTAKRIINRCTESREDVFVEVQYSPSGNWSASIV